MRFSTIFISIATLSISVNAGYHCKCQGPTIAAAYIATVVCCEEWGYPLSTVEGSNSSSMLSSSQSPNRGPANMIHHPQRPTLLSVTKSLPNPPHPRQSKSPIYILPYHPHPHPKVRNPYPRPRITSPAHVPPPPSLAVPRHAQHMLSARLPTRGRGSAVDSNFLRSYYSLQLR
ncbi:hypothetical protein EJ07DRAFT_152528 [Lizonia empirigonia]|nr:hypothetical protein EJ07DRAFT_152528 [Lizonia empirigonia]